MIEATWELGAAHRLAALAVYRTLKTRDLITPTRFDRWNASTGQVETVHYLYNGANQVECIDADANGACNGTEFWVYDAHGNLLNDGSMQYTYDAAMRLKTVTTNGVTTTYKYNGDGARMEQSVSNGILPATVTTYTLDVNLPLTQVLSETTSGQTTRYLHGLDLIAQSDGASTEYLAYDGLGSVRQLIDGSGAVLTSQTFDPYGTPYSADEQAAGSFGFTGEQVDENGLVYLRARYYNPAQGRFMQVDPSRMERNGYQYARCNPLTHTDPSGNCASLFKIIGGFAQGFTELGSPGSSGDEPFRRAFEAAAAECEDNIDFYSNSLFNPHASYAPVFGSAYNQAFWKMTVGPTLEDFAIGTTEQVHSFNRIVGAGNAGRWLGREDTSGYYFNRPDRYAIDMMGATGIVMEFTMLFAPDPRYFGINPSIGIVDDFVGDLLYGSSRRVVGSSAYDALTLESSVLLDSGEAIPVKALYGHSIADPVYGGFSPRLVDQFGNAKGIASGRPFFVDEIGLPIRNLSTKNVRITDKGIDTLEFHLSRFESTQENAAAIARLRAIRAGELEATSYDLNLYTHELREFVRYRYLGYRTGQPVDGYRFWNNLHTATLEDYYLNDTLLYHPSITGGN